MTVEPPEIQPVVVEVSSASVPSFFSSYPEGFVMAFTPEESSSVSSTPSSQAEGSAAIVLTKFTLYLSIYSLIYLFI